MRGGWKARQEVCDSESAGVFERYEKELANGGRLIEQDLDILSSLVGNTLADARGLVRELEESNR